MAFTTSRPEWSKEWTKVKQTEKKIASKLIDELLSQGFELSVNDGEELTVKKSTDKKTIMDAMQTTDEDYLIVTNTKGFRGWFRFIYGESGWDVIADYTCNMDGFFNATNAYIETLY